MTHRRLALRRWLVRSGSLVQKRLSPVCVPLLDQFTDADSVDLTAHAVAPDNPGGLQWEKIADTAVAILTNKARRALGGGVEGVYALDPGTADLRITVKITPVTAFDGYSGIVARLTDEAHYWRIGINITDRMRIVEVNGGETVRAMVTPTIDQGVEYTVAATLDGAAISSTLDGGSPMSYSSATFNQTRTKHGVLLRYPGDLADDFQMEALV